MEAVRAINYLTDWLPEMKRNYTTNFSPTLMQKKMETFGNQAQTSSWLWWPAATAGATGKWGLTNDKQRKGPTPWDGGSGSSEKRRSQTLNLKNEK